MICRVNGCECEVARGIGITICLAHEQEWDSMPMADTRYPIAMRLQAWQEFLENDEGAA